ncbi:MAG: DMT family transporter [Oscillospiraceae bacterium]
MSRQRKADLLLVLATAFWGVSYYLLDLCLTELPPLTLNAFRFLTAFFVLGAIFFRKLRSISRRTLLASIPIGLCLVLTYIGCTYGVLYTSLSNAGFICALPVVVTPLLEWLFLRKRPDRRLAVALVLCTVGMGLMTLNGALRPAIGDIICLLCAVAYAGDLVLTDRAVHDPQVNALQLGILQLGVVGFVMLGLAFLLEKPCLPQTPAVWGAALFLGVFCSGVGFVIQTVQQQYTSASHVGLIFTLEPVFSAIVAYFFAHEVLQLRGYIGAALMMVSLLVMELDWKSLLRRRE